VHHILQVVLEANTNFLSRVVLAYLELYILVVVIERLEGPVLLGLPAFGYSPDYYRLGGLLVLFDEVRFGKLVVVHPIDLVRTLE